MAGGVCAEPPEGLIHHFHEGLQRIPGETRVCGKSAHMDQAPFGATLLLVGGAGQILCGYSPEVGEAGRPIH